MSTYRMDELTKDLFTKEEFLSKVNDSWVEAEREFQTTLVVESKRLAVITNNVVVEVVNLDEKVKDIEVKLVSTIIDLGKMEQELSSSKKWE